MLYHVMSRYNEPFSQNFSGRNYTSETHAVDTLANCGRIPPHMNFQQPFNLMPPRFLPPPNFQMEMKQGIPFRNFSKDMQHFLPQFPPFSHSGSSSGMIVNPPMLPFSNTPVVPFSSRSQVPFCHSSHLQTPRPESSRLSLVMPSVPAKKPDSAQPKTADEIMVEQFLIKIGKVQKMPHPPRPPTSKGLKVC